MPAWDLYIIASGLVTRHRYRVVWDHFIHYCFHVTLYCLSHGFNVENYTNEVCTRSMTLLSALRRQPRAPGVARGPEHLRQCDTGGTLSTRIMLTSLGALIQTKGLASGNLSLGAGSLLAR